MKRLWPYIYLLIAAVVFVCNTGLFGEHEHYGHTNIDWAFVTICFVASAIFPSMAVSYARNRAIIDPPPPSLSRGLAGGWWTDPWQCLLLCALLSCSLFLGSLLTLPHASHEGAMMVWWKGAIAIGNAIGVLMAHNKYLGKNK